MTGQPLARMSVEEYLAFERSSEEKHEYLGGEIFAMGGAGRRHGLIVGNAFSALQWQLRGRPCEAFVADMRVGIEASGLFTYPDVVVAYGEPHFLDADLDTLTNPTLILEVLSPSTADYDRGAKFGHYRTLPSLQEYLVLAQDRVFAEHRLRQGDGSWHFTDATDLAATLELPSIACRLALSDVYERVFAL